MSNGGRKKPDAASATAPVAAPAQTRFSSFLAAKVKVGEVLLKDGAITEDQLKRALAQQKSSGRMLGEMLVDQGVISNAVLVRASPQPRRAESIEQILRAAPPT